MQPAHPEDTVTAAEAETGVQPPCASQAQTSPRGQDGQVDPGQTSQAHTSALTLRQASRVTLMPPDSWPLLPVHGPCLCLGQAPLGAVPGMRWPGLGQRCWLPRGRQGAPPTPSPPALGRGPRPSPGGNTPPTPACQPCFSIQPQTPPPGSSPGRRWPQCPSFVRRPPRPSSDVSPESEQARYGGGS